MALLCTCATHHAPTHAHAPKFSRARQANYSATRALAPGAREAEGRDGLTALATSAGSPGAPQARTGDVLKGRLLHFLKGAFFLYGLQFNKYPRLTLKLTRLRAEDFVTDLPLI